MSKLIDEFTDYLKNVRNFSENTVVSYRRDATLYFANMNFKSDEDCLEVTAERLDGYFKSMTENGKSNATVLRSVASIRSFYDYLNARGLIDNNPGTELNLPKQSRKPPVILSPAEVNKLLSLPKSDDPKGIRDRAMLELLYATGMKVSELISLELKDVNLNDGSLICRGKTKSRVIPIGAAAEKAVGDYISYVREDMVESKKVKTLFVNCQGKPMTRQGFWKIMKCYIAKAGIKKLVTPQTLRHSFAMHLLQNGAEFRDVSEMLGYNDELSAKIYSNMLKERIKKAYNRAHPRA